MLKSSSVKGRSSIGRAAVSKTASWGFESLRPCLVKRVLKSCHAKESQVGAVNGLGRLLIAESALVARDVCIRGVQAQSRSHGATDYVLVDLVGGCSCHVEIPHAVSASLHY